MVVVGGMLVCFEPPADASGHAAHVKYVLIVDRSACSSGQTEAKLERAVRE